MSALVKPILIIGAASSGTALLSSVIRLNEDVAYLGEPNYIWKYKNAWMGHDVIPAWRATPEIRRYIRERFERVCAETGRTRFCEKTPANALRLPFVMEVLPDAKVVHLIRDGRDVVASVRTRFHGRTRKISRLHGNESLGTRQHLHRQTSTIIRRINQRLRVGLPFRDLIYYMPEFYRSAANIVGLKQRYLWGPRIPGLSQLFRSHTEVEVAAIQWRMSVESVLNYRAANSNMDYLEVRYEDLCSDPSRETRRIYEFCELDFSPQIEAGLASLFANTAQITAQKRRMTDDEEQLVDHQIAGTLKSLGYDRHATAGREVGHMPQADSVRMHALGSS